MLLLPITTVSKVLFRGVNGTGSRRTRNGAYTSLSISSVQTLVASIGVVECAMCRQKSATSTHTSTLRVESLLSTSCLCTCAHYTYLPVPDSPALPTGDDHEREPELHRQIHSRATSQHQPRQRRSLRPPTPRRTSPPAVPLRASARCDHLHHRKQRLPRPCYISRPRLAPPRDVATCIVLSLRRPLSSAPPSDLRHPVAFLAIAVPRPVLPCRAMLERFPFLSFVFRLDSADGLRSIFIASASLASSSAPVLPWRRRASAFAFAGTRYIARVPKLEAPRSHPPVPFSSLPATVFAIAIAIVFPGAALWVRRFARHLLSARARTLPSCHPLAASRYHTPDPFSSPPAIFGGYLQRNGSSLRARPYGFRFAVRALVPSHRVIEKSAASLPAYCIEVVWMWRRSVRLVVAGVKMDRLPLSAHEAGRVMEESAFSLPTYGSGGCSRETARGSMDRLPSPRASLRVIEESASLAARVSPVPFSSSPVEMVRAARRAAVIEDSASTLAARLPIIASAPAVGVTMDPDLLARAHPLTSLRGLSPLTSLPAYRSWGCGGGVATGSARGRPVCCVRDDGPRFTPLSASESRRVIGESASSLSAY
ncbi:hypothetical protein B0H13DRAFT_2363973 [Mycena leptocephala]|nr:hypothetical protein B0H13DRAFT_2363973 [Mycena leptocephala]